MLLPGPARPDCACKQHALTLCACHRCEHLVDNAGRFGSTKINFILTHFFVDRNLDFVPEYYW